MSSKKIHMIASEAPLVAIDDRMALCGVLVFKAKPLFKLDLESGLGAIESGSTIMFCTTCLRLALAPMPGVRYIYGIAPAQQVHDQENSE